MTLRVNDFQNMVCGGGGHLFKKWKFKVFTQAIESHSSRRCLMLPSAAFTLFVPSSMSTFPSFPNFLTIHKHVGNHDLFAHRLQY